ncbi:MAG: gliding motility-associated C-terminal domain-containing protein [Ginsengibacter sp.]
MKFIYIFFLSYVSLSLNAQVITAFAGNGTFGYSGDGGPAISAQLASDIGVVADNSGNIYIADFDNNVIRKVNSAGIISTFAGNGIIGYSGDGGLATAAQLYHPAWISIDNSGNIYFIDQNGVLIRKINTSGIISTITGNLPPGYSGDGGPLIAAQFQSLTGISFDKGNNMYITDWGNYVIRKVNPAGIVTTVVGNGTPGFSGDGGQALAARLGGAYKVIFDNAGNMFIPDNGNSRIRKVNSAGIISTIAGNGTIGYGGDGGPAINAALAYPWTIAIDNANNIYVGDAGNYVVRKITPAGIISTFAGNGIFGNSGDGGPATSAELGEVSGVAVDNVGNVYVGIRFSFNVVRKINNCLNTIINLQPTDAVVCNAGDTSFTVTATNATGYQWQVNTGAGWNNITGNTSYSGSTTRQLKIIAVGLAMNKYGYQCIVTNSCGNVYSSTATLYVTTPRVPSVSIATTTDTICAGNVTTFMATSVNGGPAPAYQWKKNGINIATGNTVTSSAIADGDIITCLLTSNSNCITTNTTTSNGIIMTVNPNVIPSIQISATLNNVCSGTPVTFSANGVNGGTMPTYQWLKNGINTGASSPMYVNNTLQDGDVVTCRLITNNTCRSTDTVFSNRIIMKITLLVSPSVTITASKTSVCPGGTIFFTAIPVNAGFLPACQWKKNGVSVGINTSTYSDGSLSGGDIINCTVTSNAACMATPSAISNAIAITIFNNPMVTLDKTPTLCIGTSKILDAGNFALYLWNNGSTGRTLPVSNTGIYYVTVTDNNGCEGSDTTAITSMLPLPKGFIPTNASICSYGSLTLNATGGFKNYLWSNNVTASSITVNQPGIYSLRVTDYNTCTATETVAVVLKQCLEGFYIPNAFTPNNDGKNDTFRPLLFGNVLSYRFIVYNRFGQKVFESTNVARGWDGTIQGIQQDNNIFVWICKYQLAGSSTEIKKGSVLLIR